MSPVGIGIAREGSASDIDRVFLARHCGLCSKNVGDCHQWLRFNSDGNRFLGPVLSLLTGGGSSFMT